jgi:hypothetical protein
MEYLRVMQKPMTDSTITNREIAFTFSSNVMVSRGMNAFLPLETSVINIFGSIVQNSVVVIFENEGWFI